MSGSGETFYGPKVGLFGRLPLYFGLSRSAKRFRATDLVTRLPGLMLIWDWIGISAIGLLLETVRPDASQPSRYLVIVLCATLTANYMHLLQGYCIRSMRRVAVQITKVSLAWIGALASLALIESFTVSPGIFDKVSSAAGGFTAADVTALWAAAWFVLTWIYLCATRGMVGHLLARWQKEGRLARRVAVIGTGQAAAAIAGELQAHGDEARVVGLFADGDVSSGAGNTGNLELLAAMADTGEIDEVILAMPEDPPAALRETVEKLASTQVEVKVYPRLPNLGFPIQGFSKVAGISGLTIQSRPLAGWGAPLKRAEDVVLASLLLMLLAPVFLVIACLIKLDSAGPVLFRQERHGFNNNRFRVFKFRTMHHDPVPDPSTPQARRNDPRVTRIGAFLRRTSLDELPQILNVLRGEMSLVGPRPHATAHNDLYARLINGYLARHRVKPGITGWAQVNGWRGETETLEKMRIRLEHDLFYIANWSLLLDIKILLLTIPVVLRGTNAY